MVRISYDCLPTWFGGGENQINSTVPALLPRQFDFSVWKGQADSTRLCTIIKYFLVTGDFHNMAYCPHSSHRRTAATSSNVGARCVEYVTRLRNMVNPQELSVSSPRLVSRDFPSTCLAKNC